MPGANPGECQQPFINQGFSHGRSGGIRPPGPRAAPPPAQGAKNSPLDRFSPATRDAPFESRHFSSNQNRDTLKGIPFLMAPQEGLEPTTLRLTAECSAIELLRQMGYENFFSYPYGIRRRPTLPGRVQPSTIGAEGLNFCVRYGNRWNPFAIATGNCWLSLSAP